jgi:hypothetical protein
LSVSIQVDWKKFHKLDLVLLIPAVISGSLFITLVCEGIIITVPTEVWPSIYEGEDLQSVILFFATLFFAFLARTLGTFFIMRYLFKNVQGLSMSNVVFPSISKTRTVWFSLVIMGLPLTIIGVFIILVIFLPSDRYLSSSEVYEFTYNYMDTMFIVIDILRMLLVTKLVSWSVRTGKKKTGLLDIIKKGKRES